MLGLISIGGFVPRLELRTDGAALHPLNDPATQFTELDSKLFGSDEKIIALLSGPSVISPAGFVRLKKLHQSLERHSGIKSGSVISLANLPDISIDGSTLNLDYFLEEEPDDLAACSTLVSRALSHSFAAGLFLSTSDSAMAIYATIADSANRSSVIATLEQWAKENSDSTISISLLGPVVAEVKLGEAVIEDLKLMIPIMIAVIALAMLMTIRTPGGLIIVFVEIILTLSATFGLMALTGVPVTLVTTVLPVMIMVIAITDEAHLLHWAQRELAEALDDKSSASPLTTQPAPGSEQAKWKAATLSALVNVGNPIILTSLTTATAFLSFLTTSLDPVRFFGLFTSIGILIAMGLSLTLIPALMIVLPYKLFVTSPGRTKKAKKTGAGIEATLAFGSRRPLALMAILAAICLPGVFALSVQDSWIANFSDESEIVSSEKQYNNSFWGSYTYDWTLIASPDFFFKPEGLRLLQEVKQIATGGPFVGGAMDVLSLLSEVSAALGDSSDIPNLPAKSISELVTLAEMTQPHTLATQITPTGDAVRVRMFVNNANYEKAALLRNYLAKKSTEVKLPDGVSQHFSGDLPVALSVVKEITGNQIRSILLTALGIGIIFVTVFPRGRNGLIAFIPIVMAIIVTLGVMGYAGQTLGVATSMFATMALGVGVDFSIHFFHRYQKERAAGSDKNQSLRRTISQTGLALRWSTIILTMGFLTLAFSQTPPNQKLGLMLATVMVFSYLATFIVLPRVIRALVIIVASLFVLTPDYSLASDADSTMSGAPEKLIRQVERGFRSVPRAVRMDLVSDYPNGGVVKRTLWGLVDGDSSHTRILYVFTSPERLTGTTLLIHDLAQSDNLDSMWIHLPSLKHFKHVLSRAQRVLVPGMALSYEDSRGFITHSKYYFYPSDGTDSLDASDSDSVSLIDIIKLTGVPRTDSIAAELQYERLEISLSLELQVVLEVEFYDLAGRLAKTYQASEFKRVGLIWLPGKVNLVHLGRDIHTEVIYQYWVADGVLPTELFVSQIDSLGFTPRLNAGLSQLGLTSKSSK